MKHVICDIDTAVPRLLFIFLTSDAYLNLNTDVGGFFGQKTFLLLRLDLIFYLFYQMLNIYILYLCFFKTGLKINDSSSISFFFNHDVYCYLYSICK